MIKKIAILGSTGSIGKFTLDIISKDKRNFNIILLSTNKNIKKIQYQAKKFNVKNIIIHDYDTFNLYKTFFIKKKIKVFQNISEFNNHFPKIKFDYVMSSITGLSGLKPSLDIIKNTKKIAIANKEAIICGWNLIKRELTKHKTIFIPVDSEHFSIWSLLGKKNNISNQIEKVFITASGGPFYNVPKKKFRFIKPNSAIKHPNWQMGKKISVDSSTLMNKVFEVIEAKNIFGLSYDKIIILVHPKSYLHAIIKFIDGTCKILVHDTSMKIPIFNTLYDDNKKIKTNNVDLIKLNNLNLSYVNKKKFPIINILKNLPEKISLFETIIVSANDELVNLYLNNKIIYTDITKRLLKFIKRKEFKKYKYLMPKSISQIDKLNNYVRLKIRSLSV